MVCSLAQTYVNISGEECTFVQNEAHSGGTIYARETNVDVHSQSLLLVSNTAVETGAGAVHLSEASLTFFCDNSRAKESTVELGTASNEIIH